MRCQPLLHIISDNVVTIIMYKCGLQCVPIMILYKVSLLLLMNTMILEV